MVKVYGIRHHGPGSSKRLIQALRVYEPDCVLIEMPADSESALPFIGNKQLTPPVALLIYNPKDLKKASYYPFTSFSPEWQVALFALKHSIPIYPIDIPVGMKIPTEELERRIGFADIKQNEADANEALIKDPLGEIGKLAGFRDGERWWDAQFENRLESQEIFEVIQDMISELRTAVGGHEHPINLMREAFMRKQIRKYLKSGYKKVAIICGAWHGPVLQNWNTYPQKEDNALLKGLKTQKTAATWVPWSYEQIARNSGYGAGVISPAWYHLIYNHPASAISRWMIKAAQLLRQKSLNASTANVIEASRLAHTLASLRNKSLPGLDELEEAAVSVLCNGNQLYLDIIRQKLVIGDKIGKIGTDVPKLPLVSDLEKCLKSARLSKEWATTESIQKDLDLRKPSHLLASYLLHRLIILDIKWGKRRKGSRYKIGSFSENWTLKRRTDHAIKIIVAARWGNTIEEAAESRLIQEAKNERKISIITNFFDQALKANLTRTTPILIERLNNLTAQSKDILELLEAMPRLVQITRYGNTRKSDTESIHQLLDQIIPRINIGLPTTVHGIDDELGKTVFGNILAVNHAIGLLDQEAHNRSWVQTLQSLGELPGIHPIIQGFANRLLFDQRINSLEITSNHLQFALSIAQNTNKKALWLEGFLFGSGMLLVYNPTLWTLIDQWVENLSYTEFRSTLPLIRRAFANFSTSERQEMMRLAKRNEDPSMLPEDLFPLNHSNQASVLKVIDQIIG